MLCGNNLNNLNTIDLFINIYDGISLSPIILMEQNFKYDPLTLDTDSRQTKIINYLDLFIFSQRTFRFIQVLDSILENWACDR